MIILDYNAICIASIVSQKVDTDEQLIRHIILNSIRMHNKRFRDEYGQMVIACDHRSWRKDYFPQYKFKRKGARDESPYDWPKLFEIIGKIRDDLREHFPYKVVHIEGCEADDIIGTLTANTQEFGRHEPVMIISSDKDFIQLQKYDNVRQWSPATKKFVENTNPRLYLFEHICKGDSGDGVPNILSGDDCFVEGERQTPVTQKKMDAILADLDDGELLYAASWYRNYCRNKKLIDLDETPDELKSAIINSFDEQTDLHKKRGKVFPYLVTNRCNQLIECVGEFLNG